MKIKNKNVSKQAIILGVGVGNELSREQLGSIKIILAELESTLVTRECSASLALRKSLWNIGYTQRQAKLAQKREEQLRSIKIILAKLESTLVTFARQLAVEEYNAGVLGIGTQESKYRTFSNGGRKGEGKR